MFKLGYELKLHLNKYGKIPEEWKFFHEQLYQQNGFLGHEPGSIESIKTQWRNRIDIYKRKFGRDDGVKGNLSDLSESDCIINFFLQEVQDEEEKKKAIEAVVNQTENSVLLHILSDKSKKRRKGIDGGLADSSNNRTPNNQMSTYQMVVINQK